MPPTNQAPPEQDEGLLHSVATSMGINPEDVANAYRAIAAHPLSTLGDIVSQAGTEINNAVTNPSQTAKTTGKGVVSSFVSPEAQATAEHTFKQPGIGNKVGGAVEYLESGVPFIGPGLVKASEQARSGNYAGSAGTTAGTILPFMAGAPEDAPFRRLSAEESGGTLNRAFARPNIFEAQRNTKPMTMETGPGTDPGSLVTRVKQGGKTLSSVDMYPNDRGVDQIGMAHTAEDARGLGLSKLATNRLLDTARAGGAKSVETGPIISGGGNALVDSISRERPFTSEGGLSPRGTWDVSGQREAPALQSRLNTTTAAGPGRALPPTPAGVDLLGRPAPENLPFRGAVAAGERYSPTDVTQGLTHEIATPQEPGNRPFVEPFVENVIPREQGRPSTLSEANARTGAPSNRAFTHTPTAEQGNLIAEPGFDQRIKGIAQSLPERERGIFNKLTSEATQSQIPDIRPTGNKQLDAAINSLKNIYFAKQEQLIPGAGRVLGEFTGRTSGPKGRDIGVYRSLPEKPITKVEEANTARSFLNKVAPNPKEQHELARVRTSAPVDLSKKSVKNSAINFLGKLQTSAEQAKIPTPALTRARGIVRDVMSTAANRVLTQVAKDDLLKAGGSYTPQQIIDGLYRGRVSRTAEASLDRAAEILQREFGSGSGKPQSFPAPAKRSFMDMLIGKDIPSRKGNKEGGFARFGTKIRKAIPNR